MAEQFAQSYRAMPTGSFVLETVAPPEAVIAAIEYPPASLKRRKQSSDCSQMQRLANVRGMRISRRSVHLLRRYRGKTQLASQRAAPARPSH